MNVCEEVRWSSAFPLEPRRVFECRAVQPCQALGGNGEGSRGQLWNMWGAAKTWSSPREGQNPEESTEPLPEAASDLLGLGNMRGQPSPGRCWWWAGAQGCVSHLVSLVPACPDATCRGNSTAFPVGGCRDSRNPAGNPLRNQKDFSTEG